ncbi:MAG: glutaredoxin family protein [Candidatus Competibacteraceae bacterium]
MAQWVLYATAGCHLCEEAQRVIHRTLGMTVTEVDIADDEQLMERYGTRIPVLRRTDTGVEIGWPFDSRAIRRLLQCNC